MWKSKVPQTVILSDKEEISVNLLIQGTFVYSLREDEVDSFVHPEVVNQQCLVRAGA